MKVGFIGLGGMGKYIALNIVDAGFDLTITDLREKPVHELVERGAHSASTPREVASVCDVVFASLPTNEVSEQVALGPDGVLAGAKKGDIYVDTSTISPGLIRKIGKEAEKVGVDVIDAPVSGGIEQRKAGTLSIMLGGNEDSVAKIRPILESYGTNIFHMGELGSGATIKLVNNFTMAINMVSALEALVLGVKAGLSVDKLKEVISVSSGHSFVFDMMVEGVQNRAIEPEPGNTALMALRTVRKDITFAMDLARDLKVPVFVGTAAAQAWTSAEAQGLEDMENHALIKVLEEMSGVRVRP